MEQMEQPATACGKLSGNWNFGGCGAAGRVGFRQSCGCWLLKRPPNMGSNRLPKIAAELRAARTVARRMGTDTPNGGIGRDRVRGIAAIAILRMAKFIHWQNERPTGAAPCQPSDSSKWVGGPSALRGTPGECQVEVEEPSERKLRISLNGSWQPCCRCCATRRWLPDFNHPQNTHPGKHRIWRFLCRVRTSV